MLIRNALAALPGEEDFRRVDIRITDGKIAAIQAAGPEATPGSVAARGKESDEILDAHGLMLFPGAIDPHVHFDEPGFTHREDFLHGSAEAARGGVTTIIDMPCTSLPPVTSLEALRSKLSIVSRSALVDYGFFGGLHGGMDWNAMDDCVARLAPDVLGFKCYFVSGMDTFPAVDERVFSAAAALCSGAGRPLLLHAEDPHVLREAKSRMAAMAAVAAKGEPATSAAIPAATLRSADPGLDWHRYYAQRPMAAEIQACRKALEAAGSHAPTVHIVHVGTAEAARVVHTAGATCETCAHYLAFDEQDYPVHGAALKTAPPVKEASQKALLWRLLAEGGIDFVASDHAGAPDHEKFTGDPETAYGGIPGTGTLFPYLLSEGLFARRLNLARFLEASSGAAARRYGLSGGKGSIAIGKDADFVLVDPGATSLLEPSAMLSKSHISPFSGMRLAGKILGTFVRGRLVHGEPSFFSQNISGAPQDLPGLAGSSSATGRIFAPPGSGQFLKWGYRWEK